MSERKRCFIITPIGDEGSQIRRHIDGIIDAVIKPVLKDNFDIIVAHRMVEMGSITKQLITEIFKADLVIANITDRNPNVMYELALRHSIGKPVITIVEEGTQIPIDIISERTICYRNDAKGVLELKKVLNNAVNEVNYSILCGPVYDVLKQITREDTLLEIIKKKEDIVDTDSLSYMSYVLERLDKMETALLNAVKYTINNQSYMTFNESAKVVEFVCKFKKASNNVKAREVLKKSIENIDGVISVNKLSIDSSKKKITIVMRCFSSLSTATLWSQLDGMITRLNFEGVEILYY